MKMFMKKSGTKKTKPSNSGTLKKDAMRGAKKGAFVLGATRGLSAASDASHFADMAGTRGRAKAGVIAASAGLAAAKGAIQGGAIGAGYAGAKGAIGRKRTAMKAKSGKRAYAAPAEELDPVELLINGELDLDNLNDDDINNIIAEMDDEEIALMEQNNPELTSEDDGEEDEDDNEDQDGPDEDELLELTQEDIDGLTDEELAAGIESGELVVMEEDGDNDEDPDDDEDDSEDDDDDRSFSGHEQTVFAPRRKLSNQRNAVAQNRNRNVNQRSFASADEAYQAGIQAGASNARDQAEEVYANNREMETRAFALEETITDSHDFVDDLITNGQLEPRYRDQATALLIGAASIGGETRSFAAADMGDYGNDSLHDIAVAFMQSLPRNTAFTRMQEPNEEDIRSFSASDFNNMNYDQNLNREIDRAVKGIINTQAANGKEMGYDEAFQALKKASLNR